MASGSCGCRGGRLLAACVLGACGALLLLSLLHSYSAPQRHQEKRIRKQGKPPLHPGPEQLLDLPDFRYTLNADPCGEGNVTGVVLVTSHAEHVELRSAARRAYPRTELGRLGLHRVFLLAQLPATAQWPHRALADEARRFGDLVQGSFLEAYRNLTYKHTMGLRWSGRYCPQARFVIKMDDDIVVDFYQVLDYLEQQPAADPTLYGYVLRGLQPSREPANKWFVTPEEYPGDRYPDFLSGWLYATPPRVAAALADAAQHRRYFWIDDLMLTGLVRANLEPPGVQLRNMSALFTVHPEVLHCCIAEPDLHCGVAIGPNGGENDLIVRFQEHAARCRYGQTCRPRPPHRHVEKTCVVRGRLADQSLDLGPQSRAAAGEVRQVRMF